jgi:hypothetical protein
VELRTLVARRAVSRAPSPNAESATHTALILHLSLGDGLNADLPTLGDGNSASRIGARQPIYLWAALALLSAVRALLCRSGGIGRRASLRG